MRERFPSVEADDVIQETFLGVIKALPNYKYDPDEKGSFHNYLTGILRNIPESIVLKKPVTLKGPALYRMNGPDGLTANLSGIGDVTIELRRRLFRLKRFARWISVRDSM